MFRYRKIQGFSLIELLLVLVIIGLIAGIAIPHFMGQRRRARVVGDAMANVRVISMLLETRKADNGVYGPAEGHYTWVNGVASDPAFLPNFTPQGNSRMNFDIVIGPTPLGYTLTCFDPLLGDEVIAYRTNERGEELARLD